MAFPFSIVEHVVPGQHLREYPRATSTTHEETLYLAVKQYIPLDNPQPQPGDVTVIAAHANGFPKELYEPLWEEIYARSKTHGFRIRSIWIADVAHQGQSGVLNEHVLGNDPSWYDHSRDLLHLINLKRDEMPHPIVGLGHSMGGAHLAYLSLLHPRLFQSLVLLDPVIQRPLPTQAAFVPLRVSLSTRRRDLWPSRKAAAESFARSPFYKAWDRRVLERYVQYGLRELPTVIHPQPESSSASSPTGSEDKPVTLTTTRHQEVFTFARPNYDYNPATSQPANILETPDLVPNGPNEYPFYRPEPLFIFSQLPRIRASVLYIFGGKSNMCTPAMMHDKVSTTGTGQGGSGGAAAGRVQSVFFEDKGHLLAQEAVTECADAATQFWQTELARWRAEEDAFLRARWKSEASLVEKVTVDERWLKEIGPPPQKPKL